MQVENDVYHNTHVEKKTLVFFFFYYWILHLILLACFYLGKKIELVADSFRKMMEP